jgi:Ca2+-binding RTX toxin-like protein
MDPVSDICLTDIFVIVSVDPETRPMTRLLAPLVLAALSSTALADTIVMTPATIAVTGGGGASTITGSSGPDVIFGDPAAGDGSPVALRRVTETTDAAGKVVEADGEANFEVPVFSPDGRMIAVTSNAETLVPGKNPSGVYQVYTRDLFSGAWSILSTDAAGKPGDKNSYGGAWSSAGDRLAFATEASNFTGSPGGTDHVVVKDLKTGRVSVVSRSRVSGAPGNDGSFVPVFSPDGSRLLITSTATNLVAGDANGEADAFLLTLDDLLNDHLSMARVSLLAGGGEGAATPSSPHGETYGAAIAPDGKSVALVTGSMPLAGGSPADEAILVKTIGPVTAGGAATGALVDVSRDETGAPVAENDCLLGVPPAALVAFTPDGAEVVFTCGGKLVAADGNATYDIYARTLRDTGSHKAGDLRRLSVRTEAGVETEGNSASAFASLSPDSRRLAYVTYATNFAPGADNGEGQIVVQPFAGGVPSLVSRVPGGAQGNGDSYYSAFSPDGRRLAFVSLASDLAAPDLPTNGNSDGDIFLATLPPGPAGSDVLSGGGGADRIFGGGGNDRIDGGIGADWMFGGPGDDRFTVDTAGDRVVEYPVEGRDHVTASVSHTLADDVEDLTLAGIAVAGTGNGLANAITGNARANTLKGMAGNDTLKGLAGNDTLDGGTENDVIDGGAGKDRLTGGAGRDRFVFATVSDSRPGKARRDVITDFAGGEDVIDLSKIDGNSRKKGRQAFAFIGGKRFTGKAGQLRFFKGVLAGDTDGDRKAEFEIGVTVRSGKLSSKGLKLK